MKFEVLAKCSTTKARVSTMTLAHGPTQLPTFMPVATQAALKGLTPSQLSDLGVSLCLNNTYHLALRPGKELMTEAGGAHAFQGWNGNLLTDSGGFQMVSLVKFSEITEEGVLFASPFDGKPTMLTPEESMSIQHAIGSDIMMQLDDVVSSLVTGPRVEEAMYRSIRWLDRCIAFHKASGREDRQNLFAIVQGGLDHKLREICCDEMCKRDVPGFAVGGLSGGEAKDTFWRIVSQCTDKLPKDKPVYCMGVGFAEDLVVIVALGADMADCVFPTRTARFGVALTFDGPMNLRKANYEIDGSIIEADCPCPTCTGGMSKAFLHSMKDTTNVAHAITQHNIVFQARLMGQIRDAITNDIFPAYAKTFMKRYFAKTEIPGWVIDALLSVNVDVRV